MRKIWDFHGGVYPPENKEQSMVEPIGVLPMADEYIVPLSQHIGAPAVSCVDIGDKVLKGQLIADAQGVFSACVHAPTSGEIIETADRLIPHPSGMTAPCIVIKPDGKDQWIELDECEHYENLDHYELVEKVRKAGIAGMGGAGFPTAVKVNPRADNHIDTLILNGTECEPYITADDALMQNHAQGVVEGAKLLAKIIGHPETILIGIEDNKPKAIAAMQEAVKGSNIEVVSFPTKYPSGGEKQLIQILTGKEVPSGQIPAKIGIVVQNVGTAYACWRAVRYGEPLIERITTVVGESLDVQRNVRALVGTPIDFILEQHGFKPQNAARLIIGGPMMGFALEQTRVPVVKTTNCILAPSKQEMPPAPPAQSCIRCGLCAEACPASLLPQQLYWYAQANEFEKLEAYNLFDCIECGACSFVCPSAIPLVQYYRAAKGTIRQQEEEKKHSDRARERFERRKARIAQAEAEKEAKRLARKKAAEEAKKKLAAQADSPAAAPAAKADPASAAKAEASPEVNIKKLERALQSAQSRVDRLHKQIEEAEDEALNEKRKASLKQAEVKLKDAQTKLEQFKANGSDTPKSNDAQFEAVKQKIKHSPLEAQEKTIETLKKRLAVANEKWQEALKEEKPTAGALGQGVEKLKAKLIEAETELEVLKKDASEESASPAKAKELDAAAEAIAKAKEKAAKQAAMSDEEKQAAQIESLKSRLTKAKDRLQKAKDENSEHVDTLANTVEKLEQKLADAEAQTAE